MEFTITFRRRFDVPEGAEITYVSLGKWSYRPPGTDRAETCVDDANDTYARDTGGMRGTRWRVLRVEVLPVGGSSEFRFTVEPIETA